MDKYNVNNADIDTVNYNIKSIEQFFSYNSMYLAQFLEAIYKCVLNETMSCYILCLYIKVRFPNQLYSATENCNLLFQIVLSHPKTQF